MKCRAISLLGLVALWAAAPVPAHAQTVLKVGAYDSKPLVFKDARGDARGLYVDLLEYMAEKEGWRLEYVWGTWPQNLQWLAEARIDVVLAISQTDERSKVYDFSREAVLLDWAQIVAPDDSEIMSFLDLADKRVAVLRDDMLAAGLMDRLARFQIACEFVVVDDYAEIVRRVRDGRADAGLVDRAYAAHPECIEGLARTPIIFSPLELRFALPMGRRPDVAAAIDRHLAALKRDRKSLYYQSLSRWLPEPGRPEYPLWLLWSLGTVGGAAILFIVINFLLRAQVKSRTAALADRNVALQNEVAARGRAEEALRRERDFAKSLVDTAQVIVLVVDTEGGIVSFNRHTEHLCGYRLEEVKGRDWLETFVPARERQRLREEFPGGAEQVNIRGGVYTLLRKDGQELQIEWHAQALKDAAGNVLGILAVGLDITDRLWAEQSLRDREETLRLLFDHANDGINIAQYDFRTNKRRLISCNQRYVEMSGRSLDELMSADDLNALVHYPHSMEEKCGWHRMSLEGVPYRGTASWLRPDGKENYYEWTAAPVRKADRIIIFGIDRDITARKRAEERLRKEMELSRTLVHSTPAFYVAVDAAGRTLMMNESMLAALGYAAEEVVDRNYLSNFVPESERAGVSEVFNRLTSAPDSFHGENHVLAKDGRQLLVEWRRRSIFKADGEFDYLFGLGVDITERRKAEDERARLEAQLIQSQKLEAIGTLAGGVAHDFNNLLTGILGYANVLRLEAVPGSEVSEAAAAIEGAAQKAAQLTGQLLGFARRGKFQNVPVSLHKVIDEVLDLLSRTFDRNVTIVRGSRAEADCVMGDPGQMQQVILNLAVNARDAMPDGGTLTIATRLVGLDEDYCRAHGGTRPGRYFAVSVADTGVGIAEDVQPRIFEPFFTTKAEGKGVGMGLAMVYGIVKNHGGSVEVYSELGHGSTFKVYLPLCDHQQKRAGAGEPEPVRGSGRILVVDDEEVVRNAATKLLRGLGYDVVTADDCPQAVRYYSSAASEVDLVIIDMVMPGQGGLECFRALREINPRVRAILSTGYGMNNAVQRPLDEGMLGFVQKPYGVFELSQAVASALAR